MQNGDHHADERDWVQSVFKRTQTLRTRSYWGNCVVVLSLSKALSKSIWAAVWLGSQDSGNCQYELCNVYSGSSTHPLHFQVRQETCLCTSTVLQLCVYSVDKWERQPWQQRPQPRCNNYYFTATMQQLWGNLVGTMGQLTTTPPYARSAHALACPPLSKSKFKFKFKSESKI